MILVQEETLEAKIDTLNAELAQLQQQLDDVRSERDDLEMLLEMTTEHSDHLEEELYEKVEATLRESEKRFRVIAETMPVPVIISRVEDSSIVYANEPAGRMVGLDADGMLEHTVLEFYEDVEGVQAMQHLLQTEGQVSGYEVQGRRADGEPFWVEVSIHPLTFGDDPCLLSALYDITERKRAEQERLRLTANLEKALDQQVTLTSAYSRFVPREILHLLGKETIIDVALGDQIQQEMTVLFSDIRSFTTLSELLSPQENFNFINSYLSRVSPIIRKQRGYIDKYIGDAIMALFPEHPDDAIQASIEIQQEVVIYNEHRAKQGYMPIEIGIGLHTGNVMLGTVGEEERMEGTVISDAVNLASRMEGLTKIYGAPVVVSENMLFKLSNITQYRFRFLDKVKVKGKKEPVSVFEIFDGQPKDVMERKLQTLDDFERGLLHYHSAEFEDAVTFFKNVLRVDPDDNAAHLYLQRITHFLEYGVPVDWEGISSLTEK